MYMKRAAAAEQLLMEEAEKMDTLRRELADSRAEVQVLRAEVASAAEAAQKESTLVSESAAVCATLRDQMAELKAKHAAELAALVGSAKSIHFTGAKPD